MNVLRRRRAIATLGIVGVIVTGCQAAAVTPSPSATVPPAPTPATTPSVVPTPTATPTAPAASSPTTTPTPSATAGRPSPAPGGSWVPAGTMGADYFSGLAVPLGDGGALVIGSDGTTAERWDEGTAGWAPAAGLNAPRSYFAAVPLHDGSVLVAGGLDGSDFDRWRAYSSAYVYDPRTPAGSWTKVGLLGTARVAPAAAVLQDGRVLAAGGAYIDGPPYPTSRTSGITLAAFTPTEARPGTGSGRRFDDVAPPSVGVALATAEIFDPVTGRWSPTGSMRFARVGAVATTLSDGRVLIVGPSSTETDGYSAEMDTRVFDSTEIYDPATGRFALVGSLPDIDRAAIEADLGAGVRLPTSDPWMTSVGTLVALPDGGALLVGHVDSWKHEADVTRSFRFDARAGRWTPVGRAFADALDSAGTERHSTPGIDLAGAFAVALPDGRVMVAGGARGVAVAGGSPFESTPEARAYDSVTSTWSSLPPMREGRRYGETVLLSDGSVLIVAGNDSSSGEVTATRYAPSP